MNEAFSNFNQKELSGRDARLLREWMELDSLCEKRKAAGANPRKPSISYIIRRKNVMGLPTEYEIWYRVKSIVGVEDTPIPRKPKYGYLHKMSIVLPNNILVKICFDIFWLRQIGSIKLCLSLRVLQHHLMCVHDTIAADKTA